MKCRATTDSESQALIGGYMYNGNGQWARIYGLATERTGDVSFETRPVSVETVPLFLQQRAKREYDGTGPVVLDPASLERYLDV